MEKENERLATPLLILAYISIALSIAAAIYTIGVAGDIWVTAMDIMQIIGLLAAFYYFFLGYKKNNAVCYKIVYIIFALQFIISYLLLAFLPSVVAFDSLFFIDLALEFVLFGICLLLGICKDLGKKNSYLLNIIFLVIYAFMFFYSITTPVKNIYYAGLTINAVVAFIMTIAKYADKEARYSTQN